MKVLAVITGKLIKGTPGQGAYLIEALSMSNQLQQYWIPKSMIEYKRVTQVKGGPDDIVLEIPVWLAEEKRMDYEEKE